MLPPLPCSSILFCQWRGRQWGERLSLKVGLDGMLVRISLDSGWHFWLCLKRRLYLEYLDQGNFSKAKIMIVFSVATRRHAMYRLRQMKYSSYPLTTSRLKMNFNELDGRSTGNNKNGQAQAWITKYSRISYLPPRWVSDDIKYLNTYYTRILIESNCPRRRNSTFVGWLTFHLQDALPMLPSRINLCVNIPSCWRRTTEVVRRCIPITFECNQTRWQDVWPTHHHRAKLHRNRYWTLLSLAWVLADV